MQVLYEASESITHVYFPDQVIVSLVCNQEDGSTVEAGIVSNNGKQKLQQTSCGCHSMIRDEFHLNAQPDTAISRNETANISLARS